jgi:mRNA interferase YafQ
MAYKVITTNQFERDVKRCIKRGLPMEELRTVISMLATEGQLPKVYKPHKLSGNRDNQWECHIKPDWLLIWEQFDDQLKLLMLSTGTHSDLFGKKKR